MKTKAADLPTLPQGVRFAGDAQELHIDLGGRRKHVLPVVPVRTATSGLVTRLVDRRSPGVLFARALTIRAKEILEGNDWGWIDHSGNLHVQADGVFVHVERKGPSSRQPGVVPPQGERVIRYLLDKYPRLPTWTQLASATLLDKGYTSRILGRLSDSGLVVRERGRPIQVPYPQELFDMWQATPRRTAELNWFVDLSFTRLERAVTSSRTAFAVTGVYAAARSSGILEPERIELYVSSARAARQLATSLSATEVARGANLVTLVHRDPGILTIGVQRSNGVPVVSTSQVYRDALTYGRGRERDAATELRRTRLNW